MTSMVTSVLIVDAKLSPAIALARMLTRTIPDSSQGPLRVNVEAQFAKARASLNDTPPALLVTALQLRDYNGLHLVYLAAAAACGTRSLVHTDAFDSEQAREIRTAGAFYELRSRLPRVLPTYVTATLPQKDRRQAMLFERRLLARGGRRAADPQAVM